jgi:peptidoglycan hydrolase-like protein with peptidoglycan-binding domain
MAAPLEIIVPIRPAQIAGLELLSIATAIAVQKRLLERGYFMGSIDGVWGPKSRIALRDFKAANNLVNDDYWDVSIRNALFSNTSNKAPPGYQPPDPRNQQTGIYAHFPPPPGASFNPLNRNDPIWLQSQLNNLGYYPTRKKACGPEFGVKRRIMRCAILKPLMDYRQMTHGTSSLRTN